MKAAKKHSAAFTLMELSIVIILIALLSGGIMVGREMVKGSESRAMIKQIEQFEAARMSFAAKYNCLAGDCTTASAYNLGLDGNGNGVLDIYIVANSKELFQYWSQLSAAQLITGTYTGQPGPNGVGDYVRGVNIPATTRNDVGIGVFQFFPSSAVWPNRLGVKERADTHFYTVGKDSDASGSGFWDGAFTIAEMSGMDRKFDDGFANSGTIRVHAGAVGHNTWGCTTPLNNNADATPDFSYGTSSTALCAMWYLFWP